MLFVTTDGGKHDLSLMCFYYQSKRLVNNPDPMESIRHTVSNQVGCFVYHESTKRELQIRPIHECRCDERLKTKSEESIIRHLHWVPRGDELNRRDV